jgi:predicted nucleotidyltransferase
MPVRSLNSSVLVWPTRKEVDAAAREWAGKQFAHRPELVRVGYFGSYAHGNWGVGSDVDLLAIVRETEEPFERRALGWDLSELPVPAEILVYTEAEWKRLIATGSRFAEQVEREAVWMHP